MIELRVAASQGEYREAAVLFEEYAAGLGIDLAFQQFEKELGMLHVMYAPPVGAIIICRVGDTLAGCIGLRKIGDDIAEIKRMYVRPANRGKGIGKSLLESALTKAKILGYKTVRLDTLANMSAAIRLYRGYGFYEIPAYYYNPEKAAVYFEKKL